MTETGCLERAARLTLSISALEDEVKRLGNERRKPILALIRRHGWSQQQVAEALGMSQARVSKIVKGI